MRSAGGGCDPRSGGESGKADPRASAARRARDRPHAAVQRPSGTAKTSQGDRSPPVSLHDYGLSPLDLDLADARWQRKGIVEADTGRLLGRARVIPDDLLKQNLGHRHAADA